MQRQSTEFIDAKGKIICFYDVLVNLKTNKHYVLMPIGKGFNNPSLARLNHKTGNLSSNVRYPIDNNISKNYEIIGSKGFINA